ncbi:MAG TPA: caspase family protein [Acetobacteraceae bacterium]|nr:caspase family protein [Acetobacteraceae bacterium]
MRFAFALWLALAGIGPWLATPVHAQGGERGVSRQSVEQGQPAREGARLALVIGNGAYRHTQPLRNPSNDAEDVARTLEAAGFTVTLVRDLDRAGMTRVIREFGERAQGAAVALLYYAGHGMQLSRGVSGENFLVPVDARLNDIRDVDDETLSLTRVLERLDGAQSRIVILDACRDNPLAAQMRGQTGTRSAARGLARVETASHGSLLVFSTEPGAVAFDGQGRNSPFAAALVEHLPTPGLDVRLVLTRVRASVVAATSGRQTPWNSDGLLNEVVLRPAAPPPPAPPTPVAAPVVPPITAPAPEVLDLAFWQSFHPSRNVADYEEYLRQFPQGRFAGLARNRIEELRRVAAAPAPAPAPAPEPAPAPSPAVIRVPPQPPAPAAPRALTREEIARAQALFATLGFDPGAGDGTIGPRTRQAAEGFARAALRPEEVELNSVMLARLEEMARDFARLTERGPISPRGVIASSAPGAAERVARGWEAETARAPDPAEAAYWYALAARDGDARGLVQLGLLLVRGTGMPAADPVGGSLLWRIAAARGDAVAAYNLGAMLERGIGVAANPGWARYWYGLAAATGHAQAREAIRRVSQ